VQLTDELGPESQEALIPVDVRTLNKCAAAMCDLYQFTSHRGYVLFLAKDAPFAEELRSELRESRVRRLYIRPEEGHMYAAYLIDRLQHLGDGPEASAQEQAEVAFQAAHFLTDRLFIEPTHDVYAGIRHTVEETAEMMLRDSRVAGAMMGLTRLGTYMYDHSVNVAVFGSALAMSLNPDPYWLRSVSLGMYVHDVGKIRIPREILTMSGRFAAAQWALMKQHPGLGLVVLRSFGEDDPVVRSIVVQHHERADGSGYPRGLTGDQIVLEAKLCAAADVFDALTTARPYREPVTTYAAIDIMMKEMRQEFDRAIFERFIRLFDRSFRE